MFGLAVLFGSLVLIVVAWPEGPEYILAVRFLRSVWILTFVGTLLYVVALSAAVNQESFGSGLSPGVVARPARRRLGGAGGDRPPRARHRQRLGRAAPGTGHRPDDAAAGHRHPDARRADDRALAHRRRPRHPRRADGPRPRGGDGDLARWGRPAGAGRARRSRRGGPRPSGARVRSDLDHGDRGHGRQRPRAALPARRRVVVQRRPRSGAAVEDGPGGRDAVRRADRPPGRPGPARTGPRPVDDHGRPVAPGVRHRGRDRHRRARPERLAAVVHATQAAGVGRGRLRRRRAVRRPDDPARPHRQRQPRAASASTSCASSSAARRPARSPG